MSIISPILFDEIFLFWQQLWTTAVDTLNFFFVYIFFNLSGVSNIQIKSRKEPSCSTLDAWSFPAVLLQDFLSRSYFFLLSPFSSSLVSCPFFMLVGSANNRARQIPATIGADTKLNFLLLQDVRWRLTTRRKDMDDEEPDDPLYDIIL